MFWKFVLAGVLAVVTAAGSAHAQRGQRNAFEVLGEKTVGLGVDRDSIVLNQGEEWYRERAYRTLRFVAERNDIHLISLRIHYLNGHTEELRVDKVIRQNSELIVDLRGERSYLRQIDMRYRSNIGLSIGGGGIRLQQAIIRVEGERAPRRGPPVVDVPVARPVAALDRGLIPLGEKVVGFTVDRDVIEVGQNEDWFRTRAFRSLHLMAERSDIHLMGLRIVYLNGLVENLRVDRLIREDSDFEVDLRGDRSYIRRIEMTYRSRPSFRGQALVRVYGEPASRRDRDGDRGRDRDGDRGRDRDRDDRGRDRR